MKNYIISFILVFVSQTLFATILSPISIIPYDNVGGKIIISAVVNGKSGRFIFDTGAGPNVFSRLFTEKIDGQTIGTSQVMDSNEKSASIDHMVVDSIVLSDQKFFNSKTLISDNLIFDCFEVDGILGIDMFRDKVIQLDGSSSLLSIAPEIKEFNTENAQVLPISFLSTGEYLPYIKIDILIGTKAFPVDVLLDLGFNGIIEFSQRDFELIKKKNRKMIVQTSLSSSSVGFNGMAEDQRQYRFVVDGLKLGEKKTNGFLGVTTTNHFTMIGSELLALGKVIIDLKQQKFYLMGNGGKNFLDSKSWPISPSISDGKLVVGSIWVPNLGDFEIGDQIVKIDDKDYEDSVDLCSIITRRDTLLKNSQRAVVSIKNKAGKIVSFEMVKK